jgi:heme exporter protein CcmD
MEKLSMGEYTAIVWGAYGVAALMLLGCVWVSLRALRAAERKLHKLEASRET